MYLWKHFLTKGMAIHFLKAIFQGWLLQQTEAKQKTSERCAHPFLFNILSLLVITTPDVATAAIFPSKVTLDEL